MKKEYNMIMPNIRKYQLIETSLKKTFGEVSFNGKFTFKLADDIDEQVWRIIGIIPLKENTRSVETTEDQFYYLNSRLPQNLRNSNVDKKLEYVDQTGLKVVSDNFILEKAA
jgi:hypothetical protein